MLKVDTVVMQNQYEELGQLLQRLNEAAQEVNAVSQRLSWDVAVSKRVRQVLGQQNQHLSLLSDHAEQLRQVLLEAIRQYERTEQENAGKGNVGSTSGGGSGGGGGCGSDDHGGKDGEDWKETYDLIKKLLDAWGEVLENSDFEFAGSFMGLLMALFNLRDVKDGSYMDIVHLLSEVAKEGAGSMESIYNLLEGELGEKLAKQLGLKDKGAVAGMVSSILGIVSEAAKLQDMSATEALQQAKELIENSGDFGVSFWNIISENPAGMVVTKMWQATVESLAVAGSSMIGDIIQYMEDGHLSMEEISKIGLNGSTKGLASMLKVLTLGVVDLNPDNVIDYLENEAAKIGQSLGKKIIAGKAYMQTIGEKMDDAWNHVQNFGKGAYDTVGKVVTFGF